MNRKHLKRLSYLLLTCVAASVLAARVRASAADEIKRLAALMEWRPGTIAADIGAGDGSFTFAAVEHAGAAGKVDAPGNDPEILNEPRAQVTKRPLQQEL